MPAHLFAHVFIATVVGLHSFSFSFAQEPTIPLDAEAFFERGSTAQQLGDLESAIEQYRYAVAKQPGELRFGLKLAAALTEADQLDKAEHLLLLMKGQHPLSVDVRSLLGRVFARRGNWADAVGQLSPLEDALFPEDRVALALALIELDRAHDAEKVLDRGIEAFSESRELHYLWIDSALSQKRFTTASLRCDLTEKRTGQSPELLYRRGQALYFSGRVLGKVRLEKREDAQIGQLTPDGIVVATGRREGMFRICPADSAIWCVRAAIDAGLGTAEAWTLYARCWIEIGSGREAWAMIERFAKEILASKDLIALELAADVARDAGALDSYAAFSERRAAVDRKHATAIRKATYLALSDEYNLRGDAAMTAAFLRRSLELDEENDDIRVSLGHALWSSGKIEEAAREYLAVLSRSPRHPQRRLMLERLADSGSSESANSADP